MYMCYIGVDIVPTTFNRDCTNKEVLQFCSIRAEGSEQEEEVVGWVGVYQWMNLRPVESMRRKTKLSHLLEGRITSGMSEGRTRLEENMYKGILYSIMEG